MPDDGRLRLFFGIDPGDEARARIAEEARKLSFQPGLADDLEIRWTDENKIHLTIKFLGETDRARLPEIEERARACAALFAPFSMEIGEWGVFSDSIWAGVLRGREECCVLMRALELEMAALGFAVEKREMTPHFTVARVRGLTCAPSFIRRTITSTTLTELILFQSRSVPSGVAYDALARFPLLGERLIQESGTK